MPSTNVAVESASDIVASGATTVVASHPFDRHTRARIDDVRVAAAAHLDEALVVAGRGDRRAVRQRKLPDQLLAIEGVSYPDSPVFAACGLPQYPYVAAEIEHRDFTPAARIRSKSLSTA